MTSYLVTVTRPVSGRVTETYCVEADSEDDARELVVGADYNVGAVGEYVTTDETDLDTDPRSGSGWIDDIVPEDQP